MNQLKSNFIKNAAPKLLKELGLRNVNQLPRLEKIVINSGIGRATADKRALDVATATLHKITGQKPKITTAKASIAGFKLREGMPIGLKVTLRGERMYDFLERLIWVVIPRMRDFHGLPRKSFDKSGNYTIGIPDQAVFPELSYEDTSYTHGLEITIVIKSEMAEHSAKLLENLGLPLERQPV